MIGPAGPGCKTCDSWLHIDGLERIAFVRLSPGHKWHTVLIFRSFVWVTKCGRRFPPSRPDQGRG